MNIIVLIGGAIGLVEKLIDYINKLREQARRTGELTPEEDAGFDTRIKDVTARAHWKPGNQNPNTDT